jgi:cell division protein YceG involved in septum cleavage
MTKKFLKALVSVKTLFWMAGMLVCATALCVSIVWLGTRPPSNFPEDAVVIVMPGQSVAKVARSFQEQNVVRSTFWFTNFILLLRGETQIVSGEYYFERPLSAMAIAKRITTGDFHVSQMSTTIPEGSSISEIAVILKKNYPEFDTTRFMELARGKEGVSCIALYIGE